MTLYIVPTLRRGNSVRNAPALRNTGSPPKTFASHRFRDAGASTPAFPRRSVGTIKLRVTGFATPSLTFR